MRCESANYIGASSFMAAIKPDIKLQPTVNARTMEAVQTGCVHIMPHEYRTVKTDMIIRKAIPVTEESFLRG